MAKRRLGIIVVMLCLSLCLLPCVTLAASTADAKEQISTDNECSLTVSYLCGETAFSDQSVKLYKVAEVSSDYQYSLASNFEHTGLILNGIQTNSEWNVIRSTLETQILANGVEPSLTAETNDSGSVCFSGLKPGLYLTSSVEVSKDGYTYFFDSALVALPGVDTDGVWQYQIAITAKPEILPPIGSDEITEYKVLKLWKGDETRSDRPQSVEVEIFCNGTSMETVILSEENHWSYVWTSNLADASWNVVERNIPEGYTMTVEERDTTFVVTNTLIPDDPTPPPATPPKTGDTSNTLLYAVLMLVSGAILIILGIAGKRNRYEETD